MSYIKDSILEPYFIECTEGHYMVKEDTGKLDKLGNPKTKTLGWFTNKYSAYRRVIKCQIEKEDITRTIAEHQAEEVGLLRQIIEKLGE